MTDESRLADIRKEVNDRMLYFRPNAMQFVLGLLDAARSRNADLQSMLNAAKATELQLDARIKDLTAERDAALQRPPPVPLDVCGTPLECGSHCAQALHHKGLCLCAGDVDGEPGTCPA